MRSCVYTFGFLNGPIQGAMAGGRPDNLIIEKLKGYVPKVQSENSVDDVTARIMTRRK